jgi:hypothetical protein
MRSLLALVAMLIAAAAATVAAGNASWNRATSAAIAKLSPAGGAGFYSIAGLANLPEPAARYFRLVLRDGQPIVRSAPATQNAEFFLNGAWRPLRATQEFVTSPPGFVWDARIGMAPLVFAYVRDSYARGTGSMIASALGVYPIVNQTAAPELNAGALQRFLGEGIWVPTAFTAVVLDHLDGARRSIGDGHASRRIDRGLAGVRLRLRKRLCDVHRRGPLQGERRRLFAAAVADSVR